MFWGAESFCFFFFPLLFGQPKHRSVGECVSMCLCVCVHLFIQQINSWVRIKSVKEFKNYCFIFRFFYPLSFFFFWYYRICFGNKTGKYLCKRPVNVGLDLCYKLILILLWQCFVTDCCVQRVHNFFQGFSSFVFRIFSYLSIIS